MKRIAVALSVVCCFACLAQGSGVNEFITKCSNGNIHTLLKVNPIEVIREIGSEPYSYEYYTSDMRIFTYVDFETDSEVTSIAFIWEDDEVEEVRVGFLEGVTVQEALDCLGYLPSYISGPTRGTNRLGNIPYYTETYTREKAVRRSSSGEYAYDLVLLFVLNHLDNSVHLLSISWSY